MDDTMKAKLKKALKNPTFMSALDQFLADTRVSLTPDGSLSDDEIFIVFCEETKMIAIVPSSTWDVKKRDCLFSLRPTAVLNLSDALQAKGEIRMVDREGKSWSDLKSISDAIE